MARIHSLRLSAFVLYFLLVAFVAADDTGIYDRLSHEDSSKLLRRDALLEPRQCACMSVKPGVKLYLT